MANLATISNNILADSGIDPIDLIVGTGTVDYIAKFTAEGAIGNSIMSQSGSNILINGNITLHAGNYNNYAPTLTGGGASGTWGISITGNADTVDGYHANNAANGLPTLSSNAYWYAPAWINVDYGGIFSSINSAHLRPNAYTYGPWSVSGNRNGYNGFEFDGLVNGNVALMIGTSSNVSGFYNTSYGWQFYWNGGTMYVYKNTYGGGTQATVWDSVNAPTSTSATPNTLALRTVDGDVAVRELIMNVGVQDFIPSSMVAIFPTTNQAVKVTASGARSFLNVPTRTGGDASGTWGINITGNAAYASSAGNADTVDGYHASAFALVNGNTGQSFGVFELTYAQTQFNPSLAPRTGLNPMSIKMWDNYFAGIGLGADYGTVIDYYGRSGHVDTQVYFDAGGGSWYRSASYASGWQSWQKYVTENSGTWNISISGASATTPLLTSSGSFLTQFGSGTIGYTYAIATGTTGLFPSSDNSNATLTINRHPGDYYSQLGFSSNGELYYRRFSATAINTSLPWVTLLTSNNYNSYAVQTTGQSNWNNYSVIGNVVGLLAWKNYGNSHVIFDASQGTSPSGTSVSQTNPDAAWAVAYPTLMGWNGTNTYGVRVDSARVADTSNYASDSNLLDGQDGTYYDQRQYSRTDNYFGGYYDGAGNSKPNSSLFGAGKLKIAMLNSTNLGFSGYWNDVLWISTYTGGDVKSSHALVFDKYSTNVWVADQDFDSGSWGTGYLLLHSGNYNSYAPTLTGGGASGTWNIVSSQVTINYNNDSNSTYQMLWGSGNSVYGTALIYCNPSTDTLYSRAYRGNSNVDGTGEASYHPAGLYSGGNNWLYGTLYMAGNNQRGIGGIVQNDIMGRPNVQWGASGTATGPVVIKFPGNSANYGMVHAVIDIYEYNGNNVCTVIVGGHNWGSQWYSYGANVVGYTDKPVRVAFKDGQYCIVIGNASSSWSYGQVVLRKIQNGTYYSGIMDVGAGYTIGIDSDTYTWVSGDLRTFRSSGNMYMNENLVATQSWVTSQGYVTGGPYLPLSGGTMSGGIGMNGYNITGVGTVTSSNFTVGNAIYFGGGNNYFNWDGRINSNVGIQSASDMRAPIFYDSVNTAYYLDPNSSSVLYSATFNSTVNFSSTTIWFGGYGPGSGPGMQFENMGTLLRMAFWGLDFYDWNHGRQMLIDGNYIYVDNYLQAGASLRAPIFYDSNDTTFYLDPNSTSNLYKIRIGNGAEVPGLIGMGASYLYGMGVSGAYTAVHAHSSANGVALGYFDGTTFTSRFYVNNDGNAYAVSGMFAPIFYDSNDTSYYLNPTAGSRISTLTTEGRIYSNEWIQFSNYTGLYSPNNGAHFRPNTGSYGPWLVTGTRSGWSGIEFESLNNGNVTMMINTNSNEVGFHNNSYGWMFRWTTGTLYCYKGTYGGGATATVWDSINAPRANYNSLMYYQGFTLDANTMDTNATGFTYGVNAPTTGPIARFSTGGPYDLWLNASYGGNGTYLYYRTRNGDNGTFNSWHRIYSDAYRPYADTAGSASSVLWSNVANKPANWLNESNLIYDNVPDNLVPSGFWQSYLGAGNPTGTWFNYINVRHSNTGNGHGYQLGMSYYDNNLWFRSYQGNGSFFTWSRALGTYTDPYPSNMNQYVNTTASPTFTASMYVNADNSTGYVASRIWLYSHNNYRGAGIYMSGTGSTWFAGTPYTDFDGTYMIARRSAAGAPDAADPSYRLWQVSSGGNTYQTGSITAAGGSMTGAFVSNATAQNFTNFTARNTTSAGSMPNHLYYYIEARYNSGSNGTNVYHWVRDTWEYNITNNYHDITLGATYSGSSYVDLFRVSANGHVYATNSFRAPVFVDSADSTYYLDPASGSYLRGMVEVAGAHSTSQFRLSLRADSNGSAQGQVSLQMWCSEPGQTWNWAGFGYNVTNDGGSPGGFSRINTNFGQAYMRFSDGGDLVFYNTNTSGTRVQTAQFGNDGSATFYYAVYAPAYYESSDMRIKELIEDNYKADGIESITARMYKKNGKIEVGYYAQDVQDILPSAVSVKEDGYLNLSYREVHTAKIAYLENKIKQLEEKLNSLY